MDFVKKRFEDLPSRATPVMAADLNSMGDGIEYSVQGVDRLTDSVALKVNAADVYSRAEVDAAVTPKANKADVYTKAETFSRAETGAQITTAITASRPPLYGTGFPNGVVAAPVGTLYADTAVTNGASLWQKISGTGNTGWEVVHGSTGERNIAALLDEGWTLTGQAGARFTITRERGTVTARFTGISVRGDRYSRILARIPGFAPYGGGALGPGVMLSPPYAAITVGSSTGAGWLDAGPAAVPTGVGVSFTVYFETRDAWPSTLPGTN